MPAAASQPAVQTSARPRSAAFLSGLAVGLLILAAVLAILATRRFTMFQSLHRPVEAMLAAMKQEGLTVGEPVLISDVSGVAQAVRVSVAGRDVYLLEFDLLNPTQWEQIAGIHNAQSTSLLGEKRPAVVNKPLVLVGHDDHPEKDRLLTAFQGF